MPGSLNIHYVASAEIDKAKWDHCIDKSGNGLIYGYSRYLDTMAKNWDALVCCEGLPAEQEYEAVMPLTWNRKYGIYYLYQPFLTAQLGLFGNRTDALLLEAFLDAIPGKFRYWDIYLNHGNVFSLQPYELYKRRNYVLALDKPYEELNKAYRENIQRNVRKAKQFGCTVAKDFEVEKVIALAVEQMKRYTRESSENVERFKRLYQQLHADKKAITYGILSAQNKLLASCVFFFSHQRAYYILVGNHPNGKTQGASHALIDAFIKDHAGKNLFLDFEGSDIRNLAFFYSSFGAVEEKYSAIRLNRLPFYLRWMK